MVLALLVIAGAMFCPCGAHGQDNAALSRNVHESKAAGDVQQAVTLSREIEQSDTKDVEWANNARVMAGLILETDGKTEMLAYLTVSFEEAASMEGDVGAQRMKQLSSACYDKWENDAISVALANLDFQYNGPTENYITRMRGMMMGSGQHDEALQFIEDNKGNLDTQFIVNAKFSVVERMAPSEKIRPMAVEFAMTTESPVRAAIALRFILPSDDVSLCAGATAQQIVNGYKFDMRRKTGQVGNVQLLALANQLVRGGNARPLRVSPESLAMSDKLTESPLAEFLVPLLRGDHRTAFEYAFDRAKHAEQDDEYVQWINAAVGAIRCMDQCYNGRALEFVQYINGKTDVNPMDETSRIRDADMATEMEDTPQIDETKPKNEDVPGDDAGGVLQLLQ